MGPGQWPRHGVKRPSWAWSMEHAGPGRIPYCPASPVLMIVVGHASYKSVITPDT